MSWNPIELYYDNKLTAAIAATFAATGYPALSLLSRVDGVLWKSNQLLPQKIKHEAVSVIADYLLLYRHNLAGAMISLEHDSVIDEFSNSSLAATWGTSVAGSGSVVETTSLAITSPAANDAAILKEAATYSKTTPRRITTRSKVTTANTGVFFQGLAYRTTVGSSAAFGGDELCCCYQTPAGKIVVYYWDSGGVARFYDAVTGVWNTTSSNEVYAGALGTEYYVDLVNDGTRFRFILYAAAGEILARTTWIAFSAARASGTGNLTWFCGDPYNDAGTCAMTVYSVKLWSVVFAEDLVDNKAVLRKFNSITKSNWYLYIVPNTEIPFIAGLQLGEITVLDYADAITPYDLDNKGVVNVGSTGVVQGIHDTFIEYALSIKFLDAEAALLAKVRAWEETVGLGLFGISWDPGDHATDIRIMRRKDGKFSAPCKVGGLYNDITMNLIGVKE
jgi:hypothetical protein